MKPIAKQPNKKAAFTIVELLTVMSIIIILMGLLAPAMNRVRRFARKVSQKNQFHSINVALELFRAEFDGYPDSREVDETGAPYCGAMKLAEAMMGQDLLGFHPDSRFRADGTDGFGNPLYTPATLNARIAPFLPLENANAYRLNNIYTNFGGSTLPQDKLVLCGVYTRATHGVTGKRIGMPILYYEANTSNTRHSLNAADVPVLGDDKGQIYNYRDNNQLVQLGKPWNPPPPPPVGSGSAAGEHPLATPANFYDRTQNKKIGMPWPYRADSFILISAGFMGEYGRLGPDGSVYNFEKD